MEYELAYVKDNSNVVEIEDMEDLIKKIEYEKSKIDNNPKKWSIIKKKIHEYEYVYTSPNPKKNIAKIYPYSRSYFKIKEIINKFEILKKSNNIFSIAEAPGGFIQCFLEYDNIEKIYATSLLSDDSKIPYWNKKLLNNNKIIFEYGKNKNGDICDINNILSIIKNKRNSCEIITADGGFDYSTNYNNQEKDSLKLIHSEIFLALNIQKKNGSFICKLFDCFLKETIYLIYLLSLSYDKIFFFKPSLSRLSNSEKYIICLGFKGYNKDIVNNLYRSFFKETIYYKCPENFLINIRKFNEFYFEKQKNKINEGIQLFNKNFNLYPNKNQINIIINWCKKNNIEINNNCLYL